MSELPRTEAGRRLLDRLGDLPRLMPDDAEAIEAILAIEREAAARPLDVEAIHDALNAQAELLACYRIGKHPSGRLLDRVGKANDLRTRLSQPGGSDAE